MAMKMILHVSNGNQMELIDYARAAMMGEFMFGISKWANKNRSNIFKQGIQ